MNISATPSPKDAWNRVIGHADMDAFYAAVEILDNPSLANVPLAIGGRSKRGVVATANYRARAFGIGSAMPMATALRRCPELVVVPPRMERYKEISRAIMTVFKNYADIIQPLSLDEAFLDLTDTADHFGSPFELGQSIKADVVSKTGGLTVSVGISSTKSVAKIASDFRKPDGLTIVHPEDVKNFLAPLPVDRIWGVGPKSAEKLRALGLYHIEDIQKANSNALAPLGSLGQHCKRLSQGDDPRPVRPRGRSKSIGWERTLSQSIRGPKAIREHLVQAADGLERRLARNEYRAGGIRLKLKDDDFNIVTRQTTLETPSHVSEMLLNKALCLMEQINLDASYRLVGLSAFALVHRDDGLQLPLDFSEPR